MLWVQTETTHVEVWTCHKSLDQSGHREFCHPFHQVTTFMVSTKDGDALLYRLKSKKQKRIFTEDEMKNYQTIL